MIYTITTNPSLDYYLHLDDLKTGVLNRSESENYDAAGKGVNVSKFLDSLGIPSVTLGFLGGYNKAFYLDLLASNNKNIQPQFTTIKSNTRINVKIRGKNETSLNAKGPSISDEEYEKFSNRLNSIYANDYVVLSGNIQDELKSRIIKDVIRLINENVKVVLETDNDVVEEIASHKPFMIKMSYSSVGADKEVIFKKAKEYIDKGVRYVLYSAPHQASYLFEGGNYYICDISDKTPISLTGTSDAMITGFLWSCLKGANSLEAFTYANAVTINSNILIEEIDIKKVNNDFDTLKIERFDF